MKQQTVVSKLEQAVAKRIAQLKKWDQSEKIDRLTIKNVTSLNYQTRLNYFKNSAGTCGLNPETMEGHSYNWYSLVREFKGIVVLNTYCYSNQTAKHISKMRDVLSKLGVKYKQVEAPRGLQDLEVAKGHELYCLASRIVANKYSRKPNKRFNAKTSDGLNLLAKLGYKHSQKDLKKAIEQAEQSRRSRLDRQADRRKYLKELAAIEIVIDAENKLVGSAGYHIVHDRAWSWDGNNYTGKIADHERRSAHHNGHTKIIVHKEEPSHLTLVINE